MALSATGSMLFLVYAVAQTALGRARFDVVPATAAVLGDNGLLAGAAAGTMIVDCSTSEPDSTARLRERCAAAKLSYVDAPLARTPVEAEAGKLNVMVGADAADFARLEPVLKAFAENVFHVGAPGAGHTIKLLNNFIAQAMCTAIAEAFAVGQEEGL